MLFALLVISKISYAQSSALTEISPTTKGASITLKVSNYGEIRKQLVIASLKHKAELVDSKTNVSGKGRKYGWFRISVPYSELESLLSEIRPVGVLSGEQLTTRNRKAELNELDLRRSRMVVHVERLKGLLSNARKLEQATRFIYKIYHKNISTKQLTI
jgi:hypothetical protein